MNKCLAFFLAGLCLFANITYGGLQDDIQKLWEEEDSHKKIKMIDKIIDHRPSIEALVEALKNINFKQPEQTGVIQLTNENIDHVTRPYFLFVPDTYQPDRQTPLIVYLHGGVSRKDIIADFEEYIEDIPFTRMAQDQGYIVLYPLGQAGATWWDSVGIDNVLDLIRDTKRDYNIDDNRIYMTGFSDGGSGSFLFAMCYPDDFGGFIPLNGHPGVGSEVGEIQTYFVNLANRPLHVVNTDNDGLYPAHEIEEMILLGHKAGACIMYRIYTGIGHEFDYADEEMPRIVGFMKKNPRKLNTSIIWESAYPNTGCMWLEINEIADQERAQWHDDHNMELIDDRVMFGFYPDDDFEGIDLEMIDKEQLQEYFPSGEYEGPGVRMDKVVGDSTLCALAGMLDGDIIVRLDDMSIKTIDDVNKYKAGKECGDAVDLLILRDGTFKEFTANFPGPIRYDLFHRGKPSARIQGFYSANHFYLKASRVDVFTIKVHPDMVQLDQNVVVEVNGEKVFDEKIIPNSAYMIENALQNRDRELLYVAEINIKLN